MEYKKIYENVRIASGEKKAEIVLKNCKVVNVFTQEIMQCDIAVNEGKVIALGEYEGEEEIDIGGKYAIPGLIDSHVHVESSFVSPEEFGRALVPRGTTTTVSDPHEIVNVCGMKGLEYMVKAAEKTALDIKYMMPSCVPCTGFESSGADIGAEDMKEGIESYGAFGIGEFMNAYGILTGDKSCLEKIEMAQKEGVVIDGHSPGLLGKALSGYIAAGIKTDHECTSVEEMKQRLENGMYVQLRNGSAAKELPLLLKGINEKNARRCILCSDDLSPETILKKGNIDESLRICVQNGIDPVTAVTMATLNAAECYHLEDRGAIAPGRRADIVIVDDLKDFNVSKVFIEGKLSAENGKYLLETTKYSIENVGNSINVKDFSVEKLALGLKSEKAHVINIHEDSLLSDDLVTDVETDEAGELLFDEKKDIAKMSVIERHHGTGNVSNALIKGYGIKKGAIAISIGHDSHNILTVGTNKEDMYFAVSELIKQNGGIVLCDKGSVLEKLELPIAGLMTSLSVEETAEKLSAIERCAFEKLGINRKIEPVMTLCFMALPVIPDLKLTDKGLFHVGRQEFISVEA